MTAARRRLVWNTVIVAAIGLAVSAFAYQETTWRTGVDATCEDFQEHKEEQRGTEATLQTSVDNLARQIEIMARVLEEQRQDQREFVTEFYRTLAERRGQR